MTQDKTIRSDDLDALEQLLASHGSDRTRWPAPARLRFASLIASNGAAKRMLEEAEALDRLLELAPQPSAERVAAAAARISALAARDEGHGISILRRAPRRAARAERAWSFSFGQGGDGMGAIAAGLMAASLVVGAFAGSAGLLDRAIEPYAAAAADEADSDADATRLALGADETGLVEEERL
jgi:hypothetical protein